MDLPLRPRLVGTILLSLTIVWPILIVVLSLWDIRELKERNTERLVSQDHSSYQPVITAKLRNASHGGVYVPITGKTRPNPYLKIPKHEVVEKNGREFTMINSAYITRQLSVLTSETSGVRFRLTSRPISPETKRQNGKRKCLGVSTEKIPKSTPGSARRMEEAFVT